MDFRAFEMIFQVGTNSRSGSEGWMYIQVGCCLPKKLLSVNL